MECFHKTLCKIRPLSPLGWKRTSEHLLQSNANNITYLESNKKWSVVSIPSNIYFPNLSNKTIKRNSFENHDDWKHLSFSFYFMEIIQMENEICI